MATSALAYVFNRYIIIISFTNTMFIVVKSFGSVVDVL